MKTNVHFVLDKSASMSSVLSATISGFNEYIKTLKEDKKGQYNFSLTLFDTEVEERYSNKPLKEVEELTEKTYIPSGMTALYDAACRTIEKVQETKGKNIVVVMTDGEENSSKEYTQENFRDLVKKLEAKKNWTFVFLGANQDAWATAQKFGFSQGSTVTYRGTEKGVKAAFHNTAMATMSLNAQDADSNNAAFYSAAQKNDIENA